MNSVPDLALSSFKPKSQLKTKETIIQEPRFPVIDAHNHLGDELGGGWCHRPVSDLLELMDQVNVEALVDLDGGWGESILQERLDKFKTASPERFYFFGGVDWEAWPEKGIHFGEWAAERLKEQVNWGAQGLKIWKKFGLSVRDHKGDLVAVDDSSLDPIWLTSGELGIPVLIHVADPPAFFEPLNPTNERWEELHAHPNWQFPSPPYPPFTTILESIARLVERHPGVIFIGAHLGCYAENLEWVGGVLDRCPNFYVDISARLAELGRQPYSARRFFFEHQDRILFGLDYPPELDRYRLYYRFLETEDEYFNYDLQDPPTQGRWRIYGLYLPDEVLEKVYSLNARRIFLP